MVGLGGDRHEMQYHMGPSGIQVGCIALENTVNPAGSKDHWRLVICMLGVRPVSPAVPHSPTLLSEQIAEATI